MSELQLIPTTHYIVALSFTIELPGPDKKYVEIIGAYETLEDSKRSVSANANLIMDNDKQCLTIYKVNLEDNKVYDFYRKDLPEAVEEALKQQKQENDTHLSSAASLKAEVIYKARKDKENKDVVDFPRPHKGAQGGKTIETSPLSPITIKPVARRLVRFM